MKSRFEDLRKKNNEYVGAEHSNWWGQIVLDILDTYDKLTPTKEYLVEDPLSRITRIAKRNLLIFSSLLILVSTYGISSTGENIFGFNLNSKETYIVEGGFSIVVSYQFFSFLFHYFRDIGRLFQAKVGLAHEPLVYPLYLIQNHLIQIERCKEKQDPNIKHMVQNTDKYSDFVNKVSLSYSKVKALTSLNIIRFAAEVFAWDFIIPTALATVSLYFSYSAMFHVIGDVFAKF